VVDDAYLGGNYRKISDDSYSEAVTTPSAENGIRVPVDVEEYSASLPEMQAREFGLRLQPALSADAVEDLVQATVAAHHIVYRVTAVGGARLGDLVQHVLVDAG